MILLLPFKIFNIIYMVLYDFTYVSSVGSLCIQHHPCSVVQSNLASFFSGIQKLSPNLGYPQIYSSPEYSLPHCPSDKLFIIFKAQLKEQERRNVPVFHSKGVPLHYQFYIDFLGSMEKWCSIHPCIPSTYPITWWALSKCILHELSIYRYVSF